MKIDRRSFLAFVLGGAAGTTLSPLPWKLTDDMSIWSQTWPWIPVPPEGEYTHVKSVCTLCSGACGITVRKVDDRAVKIEGMLDHPVNKGGICILGVSGLQLLYGSDRRVKSPMKRIGERGKWESFIPISWDEAIGEVAGRLSEIRTKTEPHSVACILGSDRGTVAHLFSRFLIAYGSPNFLWTPSAQDSHDLTLHLMQGIQARAGIDIESADFLLSFGSGTIEGWGAPVRMIQANTRLHQAGSTVVQMEHRLSISAAKADKWIPVNPGTQAELALGIAHIIVKESLYDKDFVDTYAFGFDDWKDDRGTLHKGFKAHVLESYPPEEVEKITGVSKSALVGLARGFAKASNPLAICGAGAGKIPGSMGEFLSVHALNALMGRINRPGGVWAVPESDDIDWPEVKMDPVAAAGMQQERIDEAGSEKFPFAGNRLSRLSEAILSGKKSLKALLVAEANPLYSLSDPEQVRKAFEKIPLVVSFSSYKDETALHADFILPNHIYLERYEDVPAPGGFQKPIVGLCRPVVPPQHRTRHVGDTLLDLARAMGGTIAASFPWDDYQGCLEQTLGERWNSLADDGFWFDPDYAPPAWDESFETPSGKFEFYMTALKNGAVEKAVPYYQPVNIAGDAAAFPLVLVAYDSLRLAGGYIGDTPFMIKSLSDKVLKKGESFIEINPKTARSLNLDEAGRAVLSTPAGKATVRVHLFEGIMPGLVALPRGLGHSGYDRFLAGKGVNVNTLLSPVEDPISGFNAAWGIRARLDRA
jgi:anaerobic selenocysteine-containing dehydrogenase